MRRAVRLIDALLRRRMGVFEYSTDPGCVFRARLIRARAPVPVPGGRIPAGATVLELHLFNEQVPPLPPDGPDVAWAARSARMMRTSLTRLAERLERDPALADVRAVGGATALFSIGGGRGAERIFQRLGFAVTDVPEQSAWRSFWDDGYAWMLMWAFNRESVRDGRWRRMRWARFWATREQFLARHGSRPGRSSGAAAS